LSPKQVSKLVEVGVQPLTSLNKMRLPPTYPQQLPDHVSSTLLTLPPVRRISDATDCRSPPKMSPERSEEGWRSSKCVTPRDSVSTMAIPSSSALGELQRSSFLGRRMMMPSLSSVTAAAKASHRRQHLEMMLLAEERRIAQEQALAGQYTGYSQEHIRTAGKSNPFAAYSDLIMEAQNRFELPANTTSSSSFLPGSNDPALSHRMSVHPDLTGSRLGNQEIMAAAKMNRLPPLRANPLMDINTPEAPPGWNASRKKQQHEHVIVLPEESDDDEQDRSKIKRQLFVSVSDESTLCTTSMLPKKTSALNAWDSKLVELVRFEKTFGHMLVPPEFRTAEHRLGAWVRHLRVLFEQDKSRCAVDRKAKRSQLSGYRVKRLDAVGFDWHATEEQVQNKRWGVYFQLLRDFFQKNGHVNVSATHKVSGMKIGNWARLQRIARQQNDDEGRLNADQISKLDALGFDWELERDTQSSSNEKQNPDRPGEDDTTGLLKRRREEEEQLSSDCGLSLLSSTATKRMVIRKN
jgi:hypothetical protein